MQGALKDIFAEVIRLAKNRRISNKDGYGEEYRALDDYLYSLNFEDLKIIQKTMYLGRGGAYDESKSPSEIYEEIKSEIKSDYWNTQKIEANQISEKIPLDEYLIDGLNKLGIKL